MFNYLLWLRLLLPHVSSRQYAWAHTQPWHVQLPPLIVALSSEHGLVWLMFFISCTETISIPGSMLTTLGCSRTFCFPEPPESVQSLKVSDSVRGTHLCSASKWVYFTLCAKMAFWNYSWLKCRNSSRLLFVMPWKTCLASACSMRFDISVLCLLSAVVAFKQKGLQLNRRYKNKEAFS